MSLHKNLAPSEVHVPYSFTYADGYARESATGFTSSDVGKFARDLDDNTLWMLTDVAPTWVAIGSGGGGGGIPTSRSIFTGDGLLGGGDFSINRTHTVDSSVIRTTGINDFSANQSLGGFNLTNVGAINITGLATAGTLQVTTLSTGIGHVDSSGNLTSSLLVDADITSGTISTTSLASGVTYQLTGDVTNSATKVGSSSVTTVVKINGTSVPTTPGTGAFLRATNSTTAAWATIISADINSALTTSGPIGSVTPSTGAFTTLSSTGLATLASARVTGLSTGLVHSDGSGNLTSSLLLDADITGGTISPASLSSSNTYQLTSDITTSATKIGNSAAATIAALAVTTGKIAANAVTSSKVDSSIIIVAGSNPFSGDQSMGSNKLTNLATPLSGGDATNKTYVDSVAQGLKVKESVYALSLTNITISGPQTVDGLSVTNQIVALFGQSTGSQNGIWQSNAGSWTRVADFAAGSSQAGAFFFVESSGGTTYDATGWVVTSIPGSDIVGVNTLTITQFSGAGTYSAGAGLNLTGTVFSIPSLAVTPAMMTAAATFAGSGDVTISSTKVGSSATTTVLAINGTTVPSNPTVGKFLVTSGTSIGSWRVLSTADITTPLTAPGPIGSVTPSTGAFTTLSSSGLSILASARVSNLGVGLVHSDGSGNLTSSLLLDADITTGTISATSLASGVTYQLTSDITTSATKVGASAAATIAALAVTTGKIAANAVTSAKVDSSVIIASGANAFTGDQSLGSHALTNVSTINTSGLATLNTLTISGLAPSVAGIAHIAVGGSVSSSLIVDADITAATITVASLASGVTYQLTGDVTASSTKVGSSTATTVVKINGTSVPATPGTGAFLRATNSTTAAWATIVTADIATALTAPGPIGSVTPSTGAFTTLSSSGLSILASARVSNLGIGLVHSDGSGNLTSSLLVDADITSATISAASLASGVTYQLTSDITTSATKVGSSAAATIAALAVTTGKIANNAVTSAKVDSSIIIAAGSNAFTGDQSLGGHALTSVSTINTSGLATLNTLTINSLAPSNAGIAHIAIGGSVSSSLIVDADITPGSITTTSLANLKSGSGSPEGVVTAPVSTLYERTDGVAGTTLYTKISGTGNTGWATFSSGTTGTAIIDFGATPTDSTSLIITGQTAVASSSGIKAWVVYSASADHSADEHLAEPLRIITGNIIAGTGFTIYGIADSLTTGKFNVAWAY